MELTVIDTVQGFALEVGDTFMHAQPYTIKAIKEDDSDVITLTAVDEFEDEETFTINAWHEFALLAYINDEDEDI